MEDGWESHVSPLLMGVGMGEMQSMGEMQAHGQDISDEMNLSQQHHQEIAGHPDMGHDIEREMRHHHHDGLAGVSGGYYSHQSSFMTEELCQRLNLRGSPNNLAIKGVGQSLVYIHNQVQARIRYCNSVFCMFHTTKNNRTLPNVFINFVDSKTPPNIQLAYQKFNKPRKIDVTVKSREERSD
ncbi:hypothetical protein JTB14_004236 [Gonioctena quinquepunctata]|nr:hypothetical protein JTB14_004236 [Gonioctena quinquepunctata]